MQDNVDMPILEGAMNGFLGMDRMTRPHVHATLHLAFELMWQARRVESSNVWEEALELLVGLKRLTFLWSPYLVDVPILFCLLSLYRDDEAMSFVSHWSTVEHSSTDETPEWPIPVVAKDARLDDIYATFEENWSNMEARIEPMYDVDGSLTMTGTKLDVMEKFEIIDHMLLPMLLLKARVLTVLKCRIDSASDNETATVALESDYQKQLAMTKRILDYFSMSYNLHFLKQLVVDFEAFQVESSEENKPKSFVGLFAAFFAGEKAVGEMLTLVRKTTEE
jgi:hypothetical protein